MKTNKFICHVIIIVVLLALASCSRVTETGNPCQPEGCAGQAPATPDDPTVGNVQDSVYRNTIFGVVVYYPSDWTSLESVFESEAVFQFTDGENKTSNATFSFSELATEPESLQIYLETQYPGITFISYDTGSLSGFEYDDPAAGPSSSDIRYYYFLNGKILVQVYTTIFSSAEAGLQDLLAGISFE